MSASFPRPYPVSVLCLLSLLASASLAAAPHGATAAGSGLRFAVSMAEGLESQPKDGRVILLIAPKEEPEPRFQVRPGVDAIQMFGVDVDDWTPGEAAVIDGAVFGYPLDSLADLPAGDYWVQAAFHEYETFHRADGHTVKLPMDRGEGQRWNRAPGNLLSTSRKLTLDPADDRRVERRPSTSTAPGPARTSPAS